MLRRVEKVEAGSNFVVSFGIYLVTVTIFSISATVMLNILNNFPKNPSVALLVGFGLTGFGIVGGSLAAVVMALRGS